MTHQKPGGASSNLLSLPAIARRPVPETLMFRALLKTDRKSVTARLPCSPYLPKGDALNEELLYSASQRRSRSHERLQVSSDTGYSSFELPEQQFRAGGINELTLTYLRVLQRSEDYNRRAIIADRLKGLRRLERPLWQLNDMIRAMLALVDTALRDEELGREAIVEEQHRAMVGIRKSAHTSYALAKRLEDVRPTCPLIGPGQRVLLDPSCALGLTVELRWRGGTPMNVVVFVYDEQDKLLAMGDKTDVIHGAAGTVSIRHIAAIVGASSIGTGGSRSCFYLTLATLQPRSSRVVFCCFADRTAVTLKALNRIWITLYEPGQQPSHVLRELYASRGLDGSGSMTGFVFAALTRRSGDVWIFQCINEAILCGLPPSKVTQMLPSLLAGDKRQFITHHWNASRERLIGAYMAWLEEWYRHSMVLCEMDARAQLTIEQRMDRDASLRKSSWRSFRFSRSQ